jgi:hypothetical protein
MKTNKELLIKGVKYLVYTLVLMFTAPIVLFQAFKNTEHSFYIPVLVLGVILAIAAIVLGFYSIKVLMEGIFTRNK